MKTLFRFLVALLTAMAIAPWAGAQGTAFTYQGKLEDDGSPASGTYDLTFSLFNADSGGSQVGSTVDALGTGVTNGMFTVSLDFGATPFTGGAVWLQIKARTNGASSYTPLSPRQAITPTPVAIDAENYAGSITSGQLPAGVITNDENTVTFGNLHVNSNFYLPSSSLLYVGPGFLGGISTNVLVQVQGNDNFFAGLYAGNVNVSGENNTGLGVLSSLDLTAGAGNTAVGFESLAQDTGGNANTAVGSQALEANANGYNNVAVGYQALTAIGDSVDNVGEGVASLQALTQGKLNTSVGTYSFQLLTNGDQNIGLGEYAGYGLTSGTNNIYIGNLGASSESGTIRLGSDSQSNSYIAGTVHATGGLQVDTFGLDTGTVNSTWTLLFGGNTGEGIGSVRSSGYNDSYGLDFYTDFHNRMTIKQNGDVGIGTNNPSQALEVNGEFMQVDGLGGVKCYIGDDGIGNDVNIGSQTSGVTTISFYNMADKAAMNISCSSITILGGADLAEPFQIASDASQKASPGAVVVIDEANPGHLKLSDRPYDPRVAGVISGANGIHPGIQMEQQTLLEGGQNVALTGRVYVNVDASFGAVHPGDLLTTSSTPGYAMKVRSHSKAQGAILGKAMTGLLSGKGQVLTLVTLQ